MNWTKLLYILMVVLIYVPMVFLGTNAFFPDFDAEDPYIRFGAGCYEKYPVPADDSKLSSEEKAQREVTRAECEKEFSQKIKDYEEARRVHEGKKYAFIASFNLVVLLLALLIPFGVPSITAGLFFGSLSTTFFATVRYLEAESKIGFGVLVVTFFVMLFFIAKKKDILWESDKGKK